LVEVAMRNGPTVLKTLLLTMLGLLSLWRLPNAAEDPLYILPADNIERLRLDFNASRSKVRLVFMLSPT
jgi:hypothetical protein